MGQRSIYGFNDPNKFIGVPSQDEIRYKQWLRSQQPPPTSTPDFIQNLTPEQEVELAYGPILGKAAWKAAHIVDSNLSPLDALYRQVSRATKLVKKFKDSALDKFYR